jgi:hypothetical protein
MPWTFISEKKCQQFDLTELDPFSHIIVKHYLHHTFIPIDIPIPQFSMEPIRIKNNLKLARISTVVVFLALIRTLSEPFRLHHYSSMQLSYETLKPYITGALLLSIALFAMIVFSFFSKHTIVLIIAVLAILTLFITKIYGCPTC